jgi:hypothetical protein
MSSQTHRQTYSNIPRSERRAVIASVQRTMLEILQLRQTASADDIRRIVDIPAGVNPTVIGVAIRQLSEAGLIVPITIVRTARTVGHSHLIRIWRLTESVSSNSPHQ